MTVPEAVSMKQTPRLLGFANRKEYGNGSRIERRKNTMHNKRMRIVVGLLAVCFVALLSAYAQGE